MAVLGWGRFLIARNPCRHRPTAGSKGAMLSHERGTPVAPLEEAARRGGYVSLTTENIC